MGTSRKQITFDLSQDALDVAVLTQKMAEQLPWLHQCVKEITATNIGARHSSKEIPLCSVPALRRGLYPLHSFLLSPPQTLCWFAAGTPRTGLLRSDAPPAELLPPPMLRERHQKRKVPER